MGYRSKSMRITRLALPALAVALATAATAWACTPQAPLQVLGPNVVAPGERITVQGSAPAPAEIRWNSADGPIVGSTAGQEGKQFSVDVVMPDVAPGVYYLMLITQDTGVARAAVEVIPGESTPAATTSAVPSVRAVPADLWSGFTSAGESAGSPLNASTSAPSPTSPLGFGLVTVGLGALMMGCLLALKGRRARQTSNS